MSRPRKPRAEGSPGAGAKPNPFPVLDPKFLKKAVDGMLTTLSEPEYREEMERTFEFSYEATIEILQRLATVSCQLSSLKPAELSNVLNEIVPGFIKMNVSLTIELMTLMQKHSSLLLDVLEKSAQKQRPERKGG